MATANSRRRPHRAGAVLAAAVAAAAVPVFAAPASALDDTKPTPTCAGMAFEDPAGDAGAALVGPEALPVGENLDVTGGFFKYDGENVTANIRVKNLDQSIPPYALGVGWYMHYTQGGAVKFVNAEVDFTGALAFGYGTLDTGYTTEGSTKGKLFEGADGIVQIQIPGGGALDGTTLKDTYGASKALFTVPGVGGLLANADYAPDGQDGGDYNVVTCGGGAATNALGISLTGSAPKAGKKMTVALSASAPVSDLSAKLLKGRKSVATGKLASLDGDGKLTLKARKKPKKGSYTLQLTGTGAEGKSTVKLKLKLR